MSERTESTYSPEFFRDISGSAQLSSRVVLPTVFELLETRPNSLLDVGCGTGEWLATAAELGVTDVVGVDGSYIPTDQLAMSEAHFIGADLTQPLDLKRSFDLVVSLEVAEHLPTSAAETFVDTICAHSDTVLFSAAIPGQGGEHHQNERPVSYWVELFARRGYRNFDLVRPRIWTDESVMYYYRQNVMVYASGQPANYLATLVTTPPVDIVHPAQLRYWHELGVSEAWPLFTSACKRTVAKRLGFKPHATER